MDQERSRPVPPRPLLERVKGVVREAPAVRHVYLKATRLRGPVERRDPATAALRARMKGVPTPAVGLVCVYRRRNAANVTALLGQLPRDAKVALWALDETHPDLAATTVGSGPGTRFALLNRLVKTLDLDPDSWLIVVDDDIRVVSGDITLLLRTAVSLGLDLSQPAHSWDSLMSFTFVRHQLLTLARTTRFVEQGPLILLSPRARQALLPFVEDQGMGWGVEIGWLSELGPGRTGIVDGVTVRHLSPRGADYAMDSERERLDRALAKAGYRALPDLFRDDARWRVWRSGLAPVHSSAKGSSSTTPPAST